jgi:hypothetical protein
VLQRLQERKQLQKASYLVSVSGGGYMSGAFQLALCAETVGEAAPGDVFRPGSVEEDYVRRHSSYLADNPVQWLRALGVVLRGVASSLTLLALTVTVAGVSIGAFYRDTRIADLTALRPRFAWGPKPPPLAAFPVPPFGVTMAAVIVAGFALAAYLAPIAVSSLRPQQAERVWDGAAVVASAAAALVVVGAGLPAAVWASAWLSYNVGHASQGQVASAGAGTVAASYLGTLAAIVWKSKKSLAGRIGWFSKAAQGKALPYSMIQSIIIWVCLVVLCAALLLVSGWVASAPWVASSWALLPIALLLAAAAWLDQTWLSLHPFYRRRLASAFAVRRRHDDGPPTAEAYDYSEVTRLSAYAAKIKGRPQVIFAASANINGDDMTPPGRNVVSYTMAADYVGGPQLGWCCTRQLEETVMGTYLAHDLTVEAAVAVSGAAFAAAMGRQTRYYQLFLCLANARLGAWLPNPRFVAEMSRPGKDWTFPALPSRRHLSYLAREIFGIHPSTSSLLLCTDGGHYENLGLVELLRHRCRVIYCVDATGDSPPLATTLAQAITLAAEELGVRITLKDPAALVPGAAGLSLPGVSELDSRMSRSLVCVADIEYPEPVRFFDAEGLSKTPPTRHGKLIVAKTGLTADLPYQLLSYAVNNKAFPRDSTGDQWFNGDQFDAYQELGKFMADKLLDAAHVALAETDLIRPGGAVPATS